MRAPSPSASTAIPAPLRAALQMLQQAFLVTHQSARPAPAYRELTPLGLSPTDLQLLVAAGYVEHVTPRGNRIVLTPKGYAWAGAVLLGNDPIQTDGTGPLAAGEPGVVVRPRWDSERGELSVGRVPVRRLTRAAVNQVTILTAFEEVGWPWHLDDPLPPEHGTCTKRRLRQTISNLNRGLEPSLIRFRGDRTGQGLFWEPCFAGAQPPHLCLLSAPD